MSLSESTNRDAHLDRRADKDVGRYRAHQSLTPRHATLCLCGRYDKLTLLVFGEDLSEVTACAVGRADQVGCQGGVLGLIGSGAVRKGVREKGMKGGGERGERGKEKKRKESGDGG